MGSWKINEYRMRGLMLETEARIASYLSKWASICAVCQFMISFFTDRLIFDFSNINVCNYLVCKLIFLIGLFCVWNFFWFLLSRKKFKSSLTRRYVIYFAVFVGIFMILLAIAWPGTWLGDDVKNFTFLSKTADYHYWLNYLTSIYYIVSYMLIPVESAPVILNVLVAGGIFVYLACRVEKITKSHIGFIVGLPFLVPHTIFYILYPNRPVIYGLFFLLLFAITMLDYIEKRKINRMRLLLILGLTALVGFWRNEAFPILLAMPILIFLGYRIQFSWKKYGKMMLVLSVFLILLALPQKAYELVATREPVGYRNLASYLMPLSLMLNNPDFQASPEDLNKIDAVLNLEDMKKYANPGDVSCMWASDTCVRDYNEEEYNDFVKTFFHLVLTNKKTFLDARMQTFMVATSAKGDPFTTYEYIKSFYRTTFYKVLEAKTDSEVLNSFLNWIGALYLPTVVLFLALLYEIVKRRYFMFGMIATLFTIAFIIFLTAPAGYFMYYFYLYLIGWFVLMYISVDWLSLKRRAR